MSAFSELHVHDDGHRHDDRERGVGRREAALGAGAWKNSHMAETTASTSSES